MNQHIIPHGSKINQQSIDITDIADTHANVFVKNTTELAEIMGLS